jgi:methylmalonyl-CoA/ethylmalonyl-CoA epimerase
LRLHHVGILIKDISGAAELYAGRYGYKVKSEVIHDPVQGAYVQFLKLPGDHVFLEFISPDGPASHLSNALNKGGGIHHVCYAVADMDAQCAELRRKGMTLVRPTNAAVAFQGRRVAWLMGRDRALVELVEEGADGEI